MIPYASHSINNNDIIEIVRALKSDWLTQGPEVKKFENKLCSYTGAKYAIAVSSGTAALHLAMLSLDVGKGDKSITTPVTFSASANCALYVNARPEFIDIDDMTYHLDVEKLKSFLRVPSKRKNVRVVIPVHLMGTIANINAINSICDKYGIKIVEDSAHALGAKYKQTGKWTKVGHCRHSDITVFSFHPIKHIATGEGGALLTNSIKVYRKALRLRHHGIMKGKKNRPGWFYDIPSIGFNYRLTDFQSALGASQLKRLDAAVKIRRDLVNNYNRSFAEIAEIRLPYERSNTYASYHLYVIRVPANKRNLLYEYLRKNNISSQVNYIPVHLMSYYRKRFGYKLGNFPVSEKYFRECLSLPLYTDLSKAKQSKVITAVKRFFKR